jgi:hypothetical protein
LVRPDWTVLRMEKKASTIIAAEVANLSYLLIAVRSRVRSTVSVRHELPAPRFRALFRAPFHLSSRECRPSLDHVLRMRDPTTFSRTDPPSIFDHPKISPVRSCQSAGSGLI